MLSPSFRHRACCCWTGILILTTGGSAAVYGRFTAGYSSSSYSPRQLLGRATPVERDGTQNSHRFMAGTRKNMESSPALLLVLITLAIIHIVRAQDQQGFISLDCGLPAGELSPYKEEVTGLQFSSDATFIQTGKVGRIQAYKAANLQRPYMTLRYFLDGIRNCYSLNVDKGRKYLIRASFVYGNYDGLGIGPVFDLYLGPNQWATIDLETLVNGTREDILHIPTSNSLQICLVKTRETTPLISALELRPMREMILISLNLALCHFTTGVILASQDLRYGKVYFNSNNVSYYALYTEEPYDRIWISYFQTNWTHISTTLEVNNSNKYVPPKAALRNAAMPSNATAPLSIQWTATNPDNQYYLYAHFAEIQDLEPNEIREFHMVWNGKVISDPVIPPKLKITTIESLSPRTCDEGKCSFQLTRTNRSTLPPLLNAYEVYTSIEFPQSETDASDVVAMKNITATYGLSRINWQGDPCFPQQLRWDSLNCSNTEMSLPPRIVSLNLSSSRLAGTIAAAIQNLTLLERLDLSNNNLTGGVPEFLSNMKSLSLINLSGNDLNGSIPQSLQRKGLELLVEGNRKLCVSHSCRKPNKTKTLVPIVASVASAAIVIAVFVLFLVLRKKKSTAIEGLRLPPRTSMVNVTPEPSFDQKSRKFTYSEVIEMTSNFQRVLGKGGFGFGYQGTVNGLGVAVKVLSQLSTQGYKQFKAEVDLLLRVHHTNLVSLVGYCYEGDHLALVYEFLPNGNLKQHLAGEGGRSVINWGSRLRIALEAALGLEYLHIGCTPPMVHRDVKTANILLDEHFKAKLGDFGLSKSFQVGGESHDSTVIAGTLGYLDPEHLSWQFHALILLPQNDQPCLRLLASLKSVLCVKTRG
ncbi:unnamed protein product [Microthlaspi erraticum]|uniref:Protein kinase domain-containing protein n=1 Tax=Microthlaspi erraticum TaxID=1685480 RepID=A0A6D2IY52_9BRAS|nr:unnamed protein product [Microthlaspi erraticum]CAA7032178.1 unnamed protein product [Microthlaspi erraticum]